jgi:hypothetical protein
VGKTLKHVEQIKGRKVMDSIMDFHATYGLGLPLRDEFFPGSLRSDEVSWWKGRVEEYNKKRRSDHTRGDPRPISGYFEYSSVFWDDDTSRADMGPLELTEKGPKSPKAYQNPRSVRIADDDGGEPSTGIRPCPELRLSNR